MSEQPPPQQEFSNYPRPNFQSPFNRPPGIYVDMIGDAWKLLNQDILMWVACILLVFMIAFAISMPVSLLSNMLTYGEWFPMNQPKVQPSLTQALPGIGLQLLAGIPLNILYAGLFWVALRQARGETTTVGNVFIGFTRLLPLLGAGVILALIGTIPAIAMFSVTDPSAQTLSGAAVAVLAISAPLGMYVYGVFMFVPLLVIDRELGPIEAIKTSAKALGWKAFGLFFVVLITSFLASLGICACGIGILITLPLVFLVTALHYRAFFPERTVESAQPAW